MASASRTFVSSFARTAARKARSLRTAAIASAFATAVFNRARQIGGHARAAPLPHTRMTPAGQRPCRALRSGSAGVRVARAKATRCAEPPPPKDAGRRQAGARPLAAPGRRGLQNHRALPRRVVDGGGHGCRPGAEAATRHGAGRAARGLVAAGIPVGLEGPEAAHGSDAVCAAAQPAAELDCAGAEAAAVEEAAVAGAARALGRERVPGPQRRGPPRRALAREAEAREPQD